MLTGLLIAILLFVVSAAAIRSIRMRHVSPEFFTVAHGESTHEIAKHLHEQGLIWSPLAFVLWARCLEGHGAIRPGIYELSPAQYSFSLVRTLQHGPARRKITFPEGWTAKRMAEQLDKEGIISGDAFLKEVVREKREGFLFPSTYFFELGLDPSVIIGRMVLQFHQEEPKDMLAQAQALHLSYQQIVILASIVEREARVAKERPIIAGVFINRLKRHQRLESCATVEYALGAWKPQLSYKDLNVDSPYNTYRHPGLPPGPICNPGAASLEAAAHPAATDMLYFVADGHGTHRFSKNYKDHLAVQGYP